MLCKYYHFSDAEVMSMTLERVNEYIKEMETIAKLESGKEPTAKPLEGDAGFAAITKMLPRGDGSK